MCLTFCILLISRMAMVPGWYLRFGVSSDAAVAFCLPLATVAFFLPLGSEAGFCFFLGHCMWKEREFGGNEGRKEGPRQVSGGGTSGSRPSERARLDEPS